ncbi:MAG: carbohydrate ABC transporter permease [Chloroflexi bacterium]|nr:MAG: carbohydrate ABC transporter permease [Chloroflexota bacterium]
MSAPNETNSLKKRFRRNRWKNVLSDVLLWIILLIFFVPALWIILTSMRIRSEINAFPPIWIPTGFSFDSYKILFGMPTPEGAFGMGGEIPVISYARNSVIIALVSTAFALVFGTLAGYVFSRFRFRGKNGLYLGLMLARAIPGIALSLPLFIVFARSGLSDTILGMVVTYVALNIPFTAWLMDGFFRAIPRELDEAARIDGCSLWGAFIYVSLPLALPGVAAAGIFAFLTSWNEFALAGIITRTPASRTFPPALFEFTGQFVSDWRGMTAMSVLMLIPAVIFVALVQRQLLEGLTAGATKG